MLALILAGVALARIAAAGSLTGAYPALRYLKSVPFGRHSHYRQPWRAYLETAPAERFLEGIGIAANPTLGSIMGDGGCKRLVDRQVLKRNRASSARRCAAHGSRQPEQRHLVVVRLAAGRKRGESSRSNPATSAWPRRILKRRLASVRSFFVY